MKTKRNKIIGAVVALAVVFIVGVFLADNIISEKEADNIETTSSATTEKVTEEKETTYIAADETIAKAKEAYKEEIAKYQLVNEAYVTDINGDNIPEVFCRTEGVWEEFMMTYTEKAGLSVVNAERHSSMHPEIYISEDNLVYSVDEGHNVGTAFYRSAHIYEINETGFVEREEIRGKEEPENFDFTDHGEVFRLSDEYEIIFREDIKETTGDSVFKVFSEVSEKENIVEYLNEKLN